MQKPDEPNSSHKLMTISYLSQLAWIKLKQLSESKSASPWNLAVLQIWENKTDQYNITEILLKVALSAITLTVVGEN